MRFVILVGFIIAAIGGIGYGISFVQYWNHINDVSSFVSGDAMLLNPTSAWITLGVVGAPVLIFLVMFLFRQFSGSFSSFYVPNRIFCWFFGLIGLALAGMAIYQLATGQAEYQGMDATQNKDIYTFFIISMVSIATMGVGEFACFIGSFGLYDA